MFTNPGANSLPARYCLQWNGRFMYPLEKIGLSLQVHMQIWHIGLYEIRRSCVSFSTKLWTPSTRLTIIILKVETSLFFSPDQLHNYALAVHQRGAPLQNCFGFVDGTVHGIARPKYNQRVMYNGPNEYMP